MLVLLLGLAAFAGAAEIFSAVQQGDVKLVRHLLDDPAPPVRARDDDGRTALHLAADGGHLAIATALLDAGADVMARDDNHLTPLHCAARRGDVPLLQLLLARRAEHAARDDQGWTPLAWAVAMRNLEAAKALLARGAAATTRDAQGVTPLHWAAANGQLAALELLAQAGGKVNAADTDGTTPLHWAAAGGQTAGAEWLLTHGGDPTLRDQRGRTPLMVAVDQGLTETAALLRPAEQAATPMGALPAEPQFVIPDTLPPAEDAAGAGARPARTTAVPSPLRAQAVALYAGAERLYLGLGNGSIVACDPDAPETGTLIAPPVAATGVRAITTGGGAVWWLTARPALLCAYRPDSRTVTAYAAGALRPGGPLGGDGHDAPTLAWWRGRLVLCSRTGAFALEAKTGALHALLGLLPAPLAEAARGARLFLAAEGDTAVLTAVRPRGTGWTTTSWRSSGTTWSSVGAQTLAQWCGITACGPQRLALIGSTQVSELSAAAGTLTTQAVLTYGARVPAPGWAATGGDYVWWGGGDVLYHANAARQEVYAYLPWNDPGVTVRAAAADARGVWLATNRGVRRLVPDRPTALGYAGFLRLRLGAEAERPLTETERLLAATVESWQGTPYRWGGAARSGTDCSGFVMAMHQACGIAIPHGSANLRVCPTGDIVTDELRYGDVLVFPGHAALYIGNGRTAETVRNAGVGKSTIWSRRAVVVRRFINAQRPVVQLASRSGDRTTPAKRKAAVKPRR